MIWYPVQAASCFDEATLMIKHVCGFKIMHRFSYFFDSKAPHYHWNFKSLTRNRLGIFTGRQEKVTLSWKTGSCKEGSFAGQGSKKGVSPHPPILPCPLTSFKPCLSSNPLVNNILNIRHWALIELTDH